MPARITPDGTRGLIIASGELTSDQPSISLLTRLLSNCGEHVRVLILVAPDEAGDDDAELESALLVAGAREVRAHALHSRADASRSLLIDSLDQTDLLLFGPHLPLRLTALIGGTDLARAIRRRNADGLHVAALGSAAALLCEHMLANGTAGITPRVGSASLAPGLGLTNRVLIDQGGHASDRLGRLLAALALNPFALGVGIDAATAAIIGPDNVMEVIGSGGVTVIDPAEMAESNIADVAHGAPIRVTNLRLHALTGGARYDLDFRRSLPS